MFRQFNDFLAMLVMGIIMLLWVIEGLGLVKIEGTVIGATIAVFTLIAQYYWRKKPEDRNP